MDDLLREFLTETSESLDTVDNQLVRFEQEPNNAKILDNIFRLVHTIKGTCGFLGLPRLEALAHAAETLMGKFRDGMPVTGQAVTLILTTIDRIKEILGQLEATEAEPEGTDQDLIDELRSDGGARHGGTWLLAPLRRRRSTLPRCRRAGAGTRCGCGPRNEGTLVAQTLERPLRPGEVSLDELERAFRETAIEAAPAARCRRCSPSRQRRGPASSQPPPRPRRPSREAKPAPARRSQSRREPPGSRPASPTSRSGSTSIRSNT